jgi:hypothetical protein
MYVRIYVRAMSVLFSSYLIKYFLSMYVFTVPITIQGLIYT